ncbi:MAG: hypothetical protein ACI4U3_07505 [Traorella sp.]
MKYYKNEKNGNDWIEFVIGVVLLTIGLFIFSKKVYIHNDWITFRIGSMDLSSGLVTLPLIIGVIWQFYDSKSNGAKWMMILGGIFIVISVLMSIRITFMSTSLFDYLLMFGLIGAGTGILLRVISKR